MWIPVSCPEDSALGAKTGDSTHKNGPWEMMDMTCVENVALPFDWLWKFRSARDKFHNITNGESQ